VRKARSREGKVGQMKEGKQDILGLVAGDMRDHRC
jgi:hypothetical protein